MNYGELISSFLVDLQSVYRSNINIEGASFPQVLAISIIPDDGIEMSALSKKIGIDNSTATRLVMGLEKKDGSTVALQIMINVLFKLPSHKKEIKFKHS